MKHIIMLSIVYSYIILLNGCGSSSINSSNSNKEPYQHRDGESVEFTLKHNDRILIGNGTINAEVYNLDNNEYVGSDSPWNTEQLPEIYKKGSYRVYFYNLYNSNSDSTGILYYRTSGIKLKTIPINEEILIKGDTTYLFKLSLDKTKTFNIENSNILTKIYDKNLILYKQNNPMKSDNKYFNNTITLPKGNYYIVLSPWSFKGEDGVFIMTKI